MVNDDGDGITVLDVAAGWLLSLYLKSHGRITINLPDTMSNKELKEFHKNNPKQILEKALKHVEEKVKRRKSTLEEIDLRLRRADLLGSLETEFFIF